MIVLDRPDFLVCIELKPDPPDMAQYIEIEIFQEGRSDWIKLTAAEAIALADALRKAATEGRLVE